MSNLEQTSISQKTKRRVRELGIQIGVLPTGKHNSITDVNLLKVGHCTVIKDEGGCARTGVTAIVPHDGDCYREKVSASVHVINGYGKAMGLAQIGELGCIETPILLTNTLNIGLVADALVEYVLRDNPTLRSLNPAVAECNDGRLNEIEKRFVKKEHVFYALDHASSGPVDEGVVGGGTGMVAFGYKGGIGTASRIVKVDSSQYTVGVLVQANFGRRDQLVVNGVPVGRILEKSNLNESGDGSIVMVVATDAPFDSLQLSRLARRAGMGLARTGSIATNGSGDFVIAFSNAIRHNVDEEAHITIDKLSNSGKVMNLFFQAVVESTEEAILNAIFMAKDTVGRDGLKVEALPVERTLAIMKEYKCLRS